MPVIIYATTQFDPGDTDPNAYAEYELIVYEPGLPDSWIVDNDPGDEDPSSRPVRYAMIAVDFFQPTLLNPSA